MLSFVNSHHITRQLEAGIRDIINCYNRFDLPKLWGTGRRPRRYQFAL